MKRLILFVIVVAIAWYGYTHYAQLRGHGMSDVVVVNQSARALDRLRVTAGNETVVIEHLEPGATATRPFRGGSDATFRLVWETQGVLEVPGYHFALAVGVGRQVDDVAF